MELDLNHEVFSEIRGQPDVTPFQVWHRDSGKWITVKYLNGILKDLITQGLIAGASPKGYSGVWTFDYKGIAVEVDLDGHTVKTPCSERLGDWVSLCSNNAYCVVRTPPPKGFDKAFQDLLYAVFAASRLTIGGLDRFREKRRTTLCERFISLREEGGYSYQEMLRALADMVRSEDLSKPLAEEIESNQLGLF